MRALNAVCYNRREHFAYITVQCSQKYHSKGNCAICKILKVGLLTFRLLGVPTARGLAKVRAAELLILFLRFSKFFDIIVFLGICLCFNALKSNFILQWYSKG